MDVMANQEYLQDAPILFDKVYNLIMMKGPLMIRLQEYPTWRLYSPARR